MDDIVPLPTNTECGDTQTLQLGCESLDLLCESPHLLLTYTEVVDWEADRRERDILLSHPSVQLRCMYSGRHAAILLCRDRRRREQRELSFVLHGIVVEVIVRV